MRSNGSHPTSSSRRSRKWRPDRAARSAGPPEPLQRTLETLVDLPDETVLVQRNDRVPQFLFPKLDGRGYSYEAVERDDDVVTVIWRV
ncbi:hypothetical protein A6E15_09115 [Natrinema saccharevitans]|uniref:DUF2249 domain-containing protein n=1 Tax=Natrinema saccharevitans TaxID=301967 RepID=A0A1S8AWA3_9EURY|nr:DUF2249 domain-containing protein [Natrinema saccharevitans]OLZ41138.1 hypothetical protein A6E15_09115 [Natrinema saccharevitans]